MRHSPTTPPMREHPEGREPYRPSNGAEGYYFEQDWCAKCERDAAFRQWCDNDGLLSEQPAGCVILASATALGVTHPDYPAEWDHGPDDRPRCTAFTPAGRAALSANGGGR